MSSPSLSSADSSTLPPGPAEELAAFGRSLPSKALFLGLIGAWILLFVLYGNATFGYVDTSSLFGWLNYSYANSQDDELGRYIPFLVLGLCWWKRDELIETAKTPSFAGVGIVAIALALHVLGFLVQQTRLSVVAFYLGIYGLLGCVWGTRFLKVTFFPCFLFAFCVPLGTLADTITVPLRMAATTATAWVSRYILGVALIQQGNQIFDVQGTFQYEVAAACGGLRSLTATLALAAIYAFVALDRDRAWKKVVMILSALPLAVAGNTLRLTLIVIAAEAFGQKAGNWVHDNSLLSLLPYVPAFLGLGALGSWLKRKPATAEVPVSATPQVQSS
ncbi:MAG: exosortase/archaeosortase family protein [Limisphaerales bacterium]